MMSIALLLLRKEEAARCARILCSVIVCMFLRREKCNVILFLCILHVAYVCCAEGEERARAISSRQADNDLFFLSILRSSVFFSKFIYSVPILALHRFESLSLLQQSRSLHSTAQLYVFSLM